MKNRLMGLESETRDSCSVRYKFLLDDDPRNTLVQEARRGPEQWQWQWLGTNEGRASESRGG